MLRSNLLIFCILLIIVSVSSVVDYTFIADNGDFNSRWNWYPRGVPGWDDNVTIPEGSVCNVSEWNARITLNSVTNNGTFTFTGLGGHLHTHGDIYNNGRISNTMGGFDIGSGGDVVNNSEIVADGRLDITSVNIGNASGALLQGYSFYGDRGVNIHTNELANEGTIRGENGTDDGGSDVDICASRINNWGSIEAGDGGVDHEGGSVNLVVSQIWNEGVVAGGRGMGSGNGGHINVNGRFFDNSEGGVFLSGYFGVEKSLDPPWGGMINISADTVIIRSTIEAVETLFIYSNNIMIEVDEWGEIWAEQGIKMYSPAPGTIDFSATRTANTIGAGYGSIQLYSNNILAPPEGLDFIFISPFEVNPSDTTIIDGTITSRDKHKQCGVVDTMVFVVQNLSTAPRILDYSVTSALGWVTPTTGASGVLAPFGFDSFEVIFTTPDSVDSVITDTVTGILTIDGFADTSMNYLTAHHYEEITWYTFEYMITASWNLLSYPYNDTLPLDLGLPFYTPPGYCYSPEELAYFPVDTITSSIGFWLMSTFDSTSMIASLSEIDTLSYFFTPGWNIMGSPSVEIHSSEIAVYPEILMPIFGYNPIMRSYFIADTLFPGVGYWILVLDTLEFKLPE